MATTKQNPEDKPGPGGATAWASACLAIVLSVAIGLMLAAGPACAQAADPSAPPPGTDGAAQGAGAPPSGQSTKRRPAPDALPRIGVGTVNEIDRLYDRYLEIKKTLSDQYSLDVSMPFSLIPQFASAGGGKPVWLVVYNPTLSWRPFTATDVGSGRIDFATGHQTYFSRTNTEQQAARMGVNTLPIDSTNDQLSLDTLAYTQTFPGALSWLSITAGQYNLFDFDPNQYAADSQINFINEALAQDATQTFPDAGFGGYVSASSPDGQFHIAGGSQSAGNLAGDSLRSSGRYLNWGNFQWTPKVRGLGAGIYSVLAYKQPFIHDISSHSTGISFSASQELTETWGAFFRFNTASGHDVDIRTSVAAGGVRNDPFDRNPTDRIGFAVAYDATNSHAIGVEPNGAVEQETLFATPRSHEWVSEVFYNYTVSKAIRLTPDAQVFWNPALAPSRGAEGVFTVRTTLFF